MKNYVVTVGRQFGSLGRPIALKVAEQLGIAYYDRDIVEEVAKRMGKPLQLVSKEEEAANQRFGKFGKMLFPAGSGSTELQDRIFSVQECVLNDFADEGPCILVGRCADYIMRNRPELMRMFIYAPLNARIDNCVETLNMEREDARKACTAVDKARGAYHRHYAGYLPMDPNYFDVMTNSAMLGVDGTADLLTTIIQKRFGL